MRIDGKKIAEEIRSELKNRIDELKIKGVTPKLAIITLGPESSWEAYIKQKIKVADELGIKAVLINLEDADRSHLLKIIDEIETDPAYHGIIVQRPLPIYIDRAKVIEAISPQKDIDGFRPDSLYEVPVWLAVKKILEITNNQQSIINNQNYVVLGKGETAGGPIAAGLKKMGINPQIMDSKTQNREEILKNADVIISCVGKSRVITADQIKPGVILIGVGTHGEDEGLRGDYVSSEIENVAGAYTPTPGGVGPVNLSYLFSNLIEASKSFS